MSDEENSKERFSKAPAVKDEDIEGLTSDESLQQCCCTITLLDVGATPMIAGPAAWDSPHASATYISHLSETLAQRVVSDDVLASSSSSHTESSALIMPGDSPVSVARESGFAEFAGSFPNQQEENVLDAEASDLIINFCMEHRIFLKAVLDLLQERDRHAPEVGMMDPIVLKCGPLKKASHLMNGVWKVKYVEIRRGMFSYYENATKETDLKRKNMPLQANVSLCRAVKLHQKALALTPGGAIFELNVNGNKRLWMAHSREERQTWMQAINNATVGGSLTQSNDVQQTGGALRNVGPRSPFKNDLRLYVKTKTALRNAKSKTEYILALSELSDRPLTVPLKWVAKRGVLVGIENATEAAFCEETVHRSVAQLWRDLQRDAVCINGELFMGDDGHGPEAIVGALVREIMQVGGRDLSESQAMVYGRDILLAGNRTRVGGDSYFCMNTLCRNDDLVVAVPSANQVQPVRIIVDDYVNEDLSMSLRSNEKSGWIRTRNKLQRTWKKLFFVLSEGILSYYESALPRPHRLRGQLIMSDATISIIKKQHISDAKPTNLYVLSVVTKDSSLKERLLLFNSEDRLMDWTFALECTAKARVGVVSARRPNRRKASMASIGSAGLAEQATKDHAAGLGFDSHIIEDKLAMYARKATMMVHITVEALHSYKICTVDPQGDHEDTWASITAHFLQSFRLTGGPHGKIVRGEEIVKVALDDCLPIQTTSQESLDDPVSPTRRRKHSLMFRSFGNSGGGDEITSLGFDGE